jgi:hypothetical protein
MADEKVSVRPSHGALENEGMAVEKAEVRRPARDWRAQAKTLEGFCGSGVGDG